MTGWWEIAQAHTSTLLRAGSVCYGKDYPSLILPLARGGKRK